MRIVYLILAHSFPGQLVRLINTLSSAGTRFVVHIDANSDPRVEQVVSSAFDAREDVQFIGRRPSAWGSTELLLAELDGIAHALAEWPDFDYLVFLSGQDYLVRRLGELDSALRSHYPQSLVEYEELPRAEWAHGGLDRVNFHFPFELKLYGGSAFTVLTREAAEYVDWFRQAHPAFMQYFESVFISDELFLQTVLANSPLRDRLTNTNLHYVDWSLGAYPAILTTRDIPLIQRSGKYFARKFDESVDGQIFDRLDKLL